MEPEIPNGYVRVTELLSPYSGLQGVDPIILARAADRGKRVHTYCELLAQSMLIDDVEADCKPYVDSFDAWLQSVNPEVISQEERVFDHEYRVTGKFDMIVRLPGSADLVLVDLKTPQTASKTWPLQTAAYQWMLLLSGRTVQRRGCLMLDKKGRVAQFKEYNDMGDRHIFASILHTYRYFNP